jgi:hypothetical protein
VMDADNFLDIELTGANATDPDLLVAPLDRHMGGPEADAKSRKVSIRIGRRPTVHSLRALYEALEKAYPATLKLDAAYRVWVISVTVGVLQAKGSQELKYLDLNLRFPDEPRVTIQGLAPQTEFVERLKVDSETRLSVTSDVKANGDMAMPVDATNVLRLGTGVSLGAAAGAAFHASTRTDIVGHVSIQVATPVVQAVGVGDYQCAWSVKKHRLPLVGDHTFVLTLLVPKNVAALSFDARIAATVETFDLLSQRLSSDWIALECSLPREKNKPSSAAPST